MAQFIAFDPKVEVNGQTVAAVIAGFSPFHSLALDILCKHGIPEPQPGAWYSQQQWLDAFRDIAERAETSFFRIGSRILDHADCPTEIDSVTEAMAAIDVAYHMNHRGGEIGSYYFTQTTPKSGCVVCRNPYPCDFDRGIIHAMLLRFAPDNRRARVQHDDTRPCRKNGAESCTYLVSW